MWSLTVGFNELITELKIYQMRSYFFLAQCLTAIAHYASSIGTLVSSPIYTQSDCSLSVNDCKLVSLPARVFISLYLFVFVGLSVCLSVHRSICLSVCLA